MISFFYESIKKMKNWTRRNWLKFFGLANIASSAEVAAASSKKEAQTVMDNLPDFFPNPLHRPLERMVKCIVIGAGARGNTYAAYAENYKGEIEIVGVAEPREQRRSQFTERYHISTEYQFNTWEDVFKVPKFADAIMICTPDDLHYEPAMQALAMGYDLLLEKPIAQTWEECEAILAQAKKYNRIVAVCHVLRYTPYFRKIKEVVDSGRLGNIISVQHMEPIEHIHMSHSYVRGIWRREADTNPIILAKSCHDMDILRWIINKPCRDMVSFGSLSHFRKENAPQGSTMRCADGCAVEATCPYSALRIYHRERTWLYHFDLPKDMEQGEAILQELKNGNYGRCVYQCDNDVPDHQVCAMTFEDGITATFNMEAHTSYHGRRTRIMGSKGDLVGDEETLMISDFSTKKTETWRTADHTKIKSGHGGGDFGIVRDFIQAVAHQDSKILTSTIDLSMESHLMGFMAEKSRHQERVVSVTV